MKINATKVSPEELSIDEYNNYWISFINCPKGFLKDYLGDPHVSLDNGISREHWAYKFHCGLECIFTTFGNDSKIYVGINEIGKEHILNHLQFPFELGDCIEDHPGHIERINLSNKPNYELWRLDDNGNEVKMFDNLYKAQASCMEDSYTAKGHKQTYWIKKSGTNGSTE